MKARQKLYLKESIIYKITVVPLFLLIFAAACVSTSDPRTSEPAAVSRPAAEQLFTVPGEQVSHPDVYSLQLYRQGTVNSAPILRLDSSEKLVLRFDMLESRNRQFRVTVTHHDPDWSRSTLPPEFYLDRFSTVYFGGGNRSRAQRPGYWAYEYSFPNRDLSFKVSGNYLLRVEDFESGNLLFSLPFFIRENEGELASSTEVIFTPRQDLRIRHQTISRFTYPDFIEMPGFDLTFYFAQNQFWGRAKKADVFDTVTPGRVHYEMSRENAFTGDYEFLFLNLSELAVEGPRILDYQPDTVPPRILLNVDVPGLASAGSRNYPRPRTDANARYADVRFSLNPPESLSTVDGELYLTGDFNNWTLRSSNRLRYDESTGTWTTNTFIKQGTYSYKYVFLQNGRVLDLILDDTFTRSRQEYTTFVYYRDPARFYYRLLQTNTFYENGN